MNTAPPTEESPERPRSKWKFFGWATLLCVAVLGGLLAYDAKLKPYDDLVAKIDEVPDPEQNGYLYLEREWETVRKVEWYQHVEVAKITSRGLLWDDALALKIRTGREKVRDALHRAAGLPHWVPPVIDQEDHGRHASSPHSWMVGQSAFIALESCAAARAGDSERAFEIWRDLHTAATRQIGGCRDILTLLVGLALWEDSAALACDLLEWLPNDTSMLAQMEQLWSADPFTDEVIWTAVKGELPLFWAELTESGPIPIGYGAEWPAALRWFIKENVTMNRYVALVRAYGGKLMKPVATREESSTFDLERASKRNNWISPNFMGDMLVTDWGRGMANMFRSGLPARRFLPRAMRVRLALQRWRLVHGDTPPATLEELVPEFLQQVPEDPWNGKPLGWDPATWTVSAVGYDWDATAHPPDFGAGRSWFGWIDRSSEGPGLRAKLPPGAANVRP